MSFMLAEYVKIEMGFFFFPTQFPGAEKSL